MATEVRQSETNGGAPKRRRSLNPSDRRDFIPAIGLKEYWYPAISERKVKSKPVFVKMLGEDIALFRGEGGKVAALANACPHRGGFLAKGDCHFPGTIACPYHGFVFDDKGECLAVLGEGPESKMPGKIHARVYPTVTLKGVVFIWMGQGEAVAPEDDIPEEFFDEDGVVMHWVTEWPCNWRPALENLNDAHVSYVHRDSLMFLMRPLGGLGRTWTRPVQVNGVSLQRPFDAYASGSGRPAEVAAREPSGHANVANNPPPDDSYQQYYPKLNAKWPKHKWRLYWTWAFAWAGRRARRRQTVFKNPEWKAGHRLPSSTRVYYGTHMYTRNCVPVSEKETRVWYYHYAQPKNKLGKIWERAFFNVVHNWLMNTNFSSQDYSVVGPQYYDTPEKMSVSDFESIEWRKLVMKARGINIPRQQVDEPVEAEELADEGTEPEPALEATPEITVPGR